MELTDALVERRATGVPGRTAPRIIAHGDGWTVADVVCTCGPQDRPYEEEHARYAIAIVQAGSFTYRSAAGRDLMTPGSLLLGNPGQGFECAHSHGEGDRCVSFWYDPDYFERLAADLRVGRDDRRFRVPRLPALRELSTLVARAAAGLRPSAAAPWDELAVTLAAQRVTLTAGVARSKSHLPRNAEARVARAIRLVDRRPAASLPLGRLAREAGLSPYHFLRTFTQLVGVTPHQYVRRARLREAAARLAIGGDTVLDVALDCGFGDVSNFNRAFRAEFGRSPLAFQRSTR